MYDNYYVAEYLMKINEQAARKSALQAWKWSVVKPETSRFRFPDLMRKAKTAPCCSPPIQACC